MCDTQMTNISPSLNMGHSETHTKIRPVPTSELPAEFQKFDKPFGIPSYYTWRFVLALENFSLCYLMLYLLPGGYVTTKAFLVACVYGYTCGIGITVGVHRYWTHKTFKAKLPLQILLLVLQTGSFHNSIFRWCKEHRVHHKYTDTDADPHNSKRGFWFSHIGWLTEPRHPDCLEKLETIPISDLAFDPVVRFQSKYYYELTFLLCFLIPICLFKWVSPEVTLSSCFFLTMAMHCVSMQSTFLVNSVAHMWGSKPYDRDISSVDVKWVSLISAGEGWHNYHHVFPWDYKAAELPWTLNLSTIIIDFFAWIGWAYDLKTVSPKMVADRVNRTGDGTHASSESQHKTIDNENTSSKEGSMRTEEDDLMTASWGLEDATVQLSQLEVEALQYQTWYKEKTL